MAQASPAAWPPTSCHSSEALGPDALLPFFVSPAQLRAEGPSPASTGATQLELWLDFFNKHFRFMSVSLILNC